MPAHSLPMLLQLTPRTLYRPMRNASPYASPMACYAYRCPVSLAMYGFMRGALTMRYRTFKAYVS